MLVLSSSSGIPRVITLSSVLSVFPISPRSADSQDTRSCLCLFSPSENFPQARVAAFSPLQQCEELRNQTLIVRPFFIEMFWTPFKTTVKRANRLGEGMQANERLRGKMWNETAAVCQKNIKKDRRKSFITGRGFCLINNFFFYL